MIKRVIVLGGGSAGFLAAISLKMKVPGLVVEVIRSKEIGIIGVGEGTTVSVPVFLHGFLGLEPAAFHRAAQPTWKMGIRFLWGPRPYFNYTFSPQFGMQYVALPKATGFYCDDDCEHAAPASALMTHDKAFVRTKQGLPGIGRDFAYHLENVPFVAYLETQAERVGVRIIDDTIVGVEQDERGVSGLVRASGERATADLYVDCSGFASALLGKALGEPFVSFKSSLFCDRAVVGGWERGSEVIKPYTTAETMDCGWCWQIEHEHRINRGYVYSTDFVSDEAAEREFLAKNPKVGMTRVVKFVSGRYERAWVKNVVAIGNAYGFVEPLESTSLAVIADECKALSATLTETGGRPGEAIVRVYNRRNAKTWDSIRQFLAIHYKFNTRIDTPFWRACREKTELRGAQEFAEYYAENGPDTIWRNMLVEGWDVFGYEGYLSMMVGQRVPYRKTREITAKEWEVWGMIREEQKRTGMNGVGVKETLEVVRRPEWRWDPDFFKRMEVEGGRI